MLYTAHVRVYDTLDQVQVGCTVIEWDDHAQPPEHREVLNRSIRLQGHGEDDATHWLLEALHALIEDL